METSTETETSPALSKDSVSAYFRALALKSHLTIQRKYGATEHARKMAVARWTKAEREADKPDIVLS